MNKLPGYSWVDIRNKTHVFGVEDWSHPQKKEIYEKLDSLLDQIKRIQTESVLIEMDDNLKEKLLHYHSERLTVAFLLLTCPTGMPIVVKKNLRFYCPTTKCLALCEDDNQYDDFNMDEVDLNLENYEELFGMTLSHFEELLENGRIDSLFGTKDMFVVDFNR
ncbi:pentatricopeptide repeat-containing protein At2g22070-like [Glycine max]|uniref:pentatricopeptide repeat-containing protein At2g22070-like n=1 Tax=Glycine max TaxID=3847 RepID=UPI000E21BBC0|nr:pentatricopeptide repeat-containing protein At2g22070-like [Glycine max]|eukprot:XP_025985349.1 pentatricopeptide repeat-containing protein At2g22070-like [Glycine max]